MKKHITHPLTLLLLLLSIQANATNTIYGLVRQNYYSIITDPFDSTITYEQLDSSTLRMGYVDPLNGFVSNVGSTAYAQALNLTGAALNPYDSTYIFLGAYDMFTFDLNTGTIINQASMNNPMGMSYFDNFRFNNSDSSLYGLSRRSYFDPSSGTMRSGVFLAKANPQNGLITEISPAAVALGYTMSGSAIDPYQMVYYFALGNNLIGLDLYNGSIYSNVSMSITDGFAFGNFTYSCADTAIYGLVRQNYFTYEPDPFNPGDSIEVLDSATIKLGKINPATGVVTNISPYGVVQGGYTINGGAAIDPSNMIYYFSTGNSIVGISLITGLVTSNETYSFASGEFFDLMRNSENCFSAIPLRLNTGTNVVDAKQEEQRMYPNPFSDRINRTNATGKEEYVLCNSMGQVIWSGRNIEQNDFSSLSKGIYFLRVDNKVEKLIKD